MKNFFLGTVLPMIMGVVLMMIMGAVLMMSIVSIVESCTTETSPACNRTFYVEGFVDGNGDDCFWGIHVYKKQSGLWIYQFPLFNEQEFTVPVNYGEEWRWEVGFCDGATECVNFYLYEEDCQAPGEQQTEFVWTGCPQDDKLIIEKELLDYNGNKVCDLCPE